MNTILGEIGKSQKFLPFAVRLKFFHDYPFYSNGGLFAELKSAPKK